MRPIIRFSTTLIILSLLALAVCFVSRAYAAEPPTQTLVVAGGCFWGMESVFDHTKGVKQAVVGYAGGSADTAQYETVSGGSTGHAESVQITYDPKQVSLSTLLDIYFTVAHNPTELNYQGPDHGTQYRSAIFYRDDAQKAAADAKITELNAAHTFDAPIVTKLEPLKGFYAAEDYHQHYAELHPLNPYIVFNDAPKVETLKAKFPTYFVEQ